MHIAGQRLWPNRWPIRRVPTIHAIIKNYRKYRQHGTSLNKNKVNSGKHLQFLVTFVIEGKIKDKMLWFQSTTSYRLLSIELDFVDGSLIYAMVHKLSSV